MATDEGGETRVGAIGMVHVRVGGGAERLAELRRRHDSRVVLLLQLLELVHKHHLQLIRHKSIHPGLNRLDNRLAKPQACHPDELDRQK